MDGYEERKNDEGYSHNNCKTLRYSNKKAYQWNQV
jgi:hypothetical protein